MKIEICKVGYLETNCYILSKGDNVLIIDPGDEYDKINKVIKGRNIIGVIITHYHDDHIGALSHFNQNIIYDKNNLKEGSNIIGDFTFDIIYTPGHKEDAITIYFKEDKIMFTGDFIFKGAIGRMDLIGGNEKDMINSLNKIKEYCNYNILVYPGHGGITNLKEEVS